MSNEKTYAVVTFVMNGSPHPLNQEGPEPYQFISYCAHDHMSFDDSVECLRQTHIATRGIRPGAYYTMAIRDPAHMPSSTSSLGGYVRANGSELIFDDAAASIMNWFHNEVSNPLDKELAEAENMKLSIERQEQIDTVVAWKRRHPIRWKLAMGRGVWTKPDRHGVRSQRYITFLLPSKLRCIMMDFRAPTKEELYTGKVKR